MVLGFQVSLDVVYANTNWLSDNWDYRKTHLILGSSGAGEGYQVMIIANYSDGSDSGNTVYLNGSCRTDFGDIRFTDNDGVTELVYWLAKKVDSDYAVFWVKVEDDLDSDVTIYIYFGNNDVSTTSNFDSTFIFGDLFNSAVLNTSKWVTVNRNPTYSIDTTNHYIEVTDLDADSWITGCFQSDDLDFPDGWILESAYNISNGMYVYMQTFDAGDYTILELNFNSTNHNALSVGDLWVTVRSRYVVYMDGGVGYNPGSVASAIQTSRWSINYSDSDLSYYQEGVLRISDNPNIVFDKFTLLFGRYSSTAFGTVRFGDFLIRKYVISEPVHSVWGSLEYGLKSITFYFGNGGLFYYNGTLIVNGSSINFSNKTYIQFQGFPNSSYSFSSFNYSGSGFVDNPYMYQVINFDDLTVWCYFSLLELNLDYVYVFGALAFMVFGVFVLLRKKF